jgi:hypothetical protein
MVRIVADRPAAAGARWAGAIPAPRPLRRLLGEREGGAAPRQQGPHQAQARDATAHLAEVEARRQRAGGRDADVDVVALRSQWQRTSPPCPCLMALVSSSLTVSATGMDSGSGSTWGSSADQIHHDGAAEVALQRLRDGPQQPAHSQRPARAHLQAVDLGDGLHLAHGLGQHIGHFGPARGVLLQQAGHALQVVLDAVVHLAHQHLALRDGGLQAGAFRGPLFGHVAGHQQQLRRGGRVVGQVGDAHVPDTLGRPGSSRHSCTCTGSPGPPAAASDSQACRACGLRRGQHSASGWPSMCAVSWPKKAAAVWLSCCTCRLVASNSAMASGAVSITRCSEAWVCAVRTSAWRRRSMSSRAKVSSGAPAHRRRRCARRCPPPRTRGRRARAAGTRRSRPGLRPGAAASRRGAADVRLGRGHGADRLADEVRQFAAEHAAGRPVHPFDALPRHRDDAHQHRVEDGACAVGLRGQRLARAAALVDVDVGADHAAFGVVAVHRAHAHLHPAQAAVAPAQQPLAAEAAVLAQALHDAGFEIHTLARVFVELGSVQRAQLRAGPAGQRGHRLVGPFDARAALVDDAHLREVEHQLAVAHQALQFGLLGLQPRDVGQHGHGFGLRPSGWARRTESEYQRNWSSWPGQRQLGLEGPALGQRVQRFAHTIQRADAAAEDLLQRGTRRGAGLEAQHALEAQVAAHQQRAAQVGDAGGGTVQDGRQFAQQLFVAALRAFLVGHVQRDDRGGGAAAGQCAGLHAGQQPARRPAPGGARHNAPRCVRHGAARAAGVRTRAARRARPVRARCPAGPRHRGLVADAAGPAPPACARRVAAPASRG